MGTATIAIPANPRLDTPENGTDAVLRLNRPLIGRQAQIAAGTVLEHRTTPAPPLPTPDEKQALIDSIIDKRTILERLRDQMDATKTVTASFMGQITDSMEIADNQARGKALELGLKLHQLIDGDNGRISVGTVNVLFAGALPDWTEHKGNSDTAVITPPLSTVEGTAVGPGGIAHTNPASADGPSCVNTLGSNASVPVQAVPAVSVPAASVPAKSKLSSRVVKKRVARLPVYRGDV